MKLRAKLAWDFRDYEALGIPRRYLIFRPDAKFTRALGKFLKMAAERQAKKEIGPVPLSVSLEYEERRSLDANALMWALYDLEAEAMNAGRLGPDRITKAQLYRQDMLAFAPAFTVRVPMDGLARLTRIVREDRIKEAVEEDGFLRVTVMETSSLWDPGRMHVHIDMLFNRLSASGLPMHLQDKALVSWLDWRRALDDGKIVLHTEPMREEEYRDRQQSCEACGRFIGDGSGQLAHISSRGSGATWGPEKQDPRNWLHLCGSCHVGADDSQHTAGWSVFLGKAPHLRFKVQEALRREIK